MKISTQRMYQTHKSEIFSKFYFRSNANLRVGDLIS